jgi:hypothetical protein
MNNRKLLALLAVVFGAAMSYEVCVLTPGDQIFSAFASGGIWGWGLAELLFVRDRSDA